MKHVIVAELTIGYPDSNMNEHDLKEVQAALEELFSGLGMTLDSSCVLVEGDEDVE